MEQIFYFQENLLLCTFELSLCEYSVEVLNRQKFQDKQYVRLFETLEDTKREITPSNKTPALTESMNMDIWLLGASNQLFIRGSQTESNLLKR